MRRYLALFITLLCLISITSGVFAMTPRVKFPKWNNTNIKITDWNPASGILTLTVTVEANRIPLEKVYSQPYLQSSFKTIQNKFEKDSVKYGEKAVFTHRLNIKSNSNDWIEMDVRAKPNIAGMKNLIRSEYVNNEAMCGVLEAEADSIKTPIFIGTSMPVLVRDDIALDVTPEIAFTPSFENNKSNYYIWMPLDSAESKTTGSAIKLFKEAVAKKDLQTIEATCQNLIKRFDTDKKAIVFKRAKGDNFMIPTKVAIEMLNADLATLKAILSGKAEELENTYKAMKPCYTKAFLAYNLSVLYSSLNQADKAKQYKEEALAENPAWPAAKKLANE